MTSIPISALPSQEFRVVLDDQDCTISLYWRQDKVYLDLHVDQTPIIVGALCQNRANIIKTASPYFRGTLHFVDLLGESAPYWEDLDTRYILLYATQEEELPEGLRY